MSTGIATRNHRQRGFTLAEILVTTAIFAIIMIAALTVYDRSNQVFKQSTEAADLQQSTRIGFEKLVSDVRMAGFDYNRGGSPTGDGQAPQPDEQIEYAGPSAVVFRANFNYNVASSAGNGLELNYEPKNVNNAPIFPYVTTSNDEVIAYVLRSNDSSKNTGSIKFYVDDYLPRAAFPSTISPAPKATNPSHPEEMVTIGNIDTTNNNPPYTLYRMTLSDVKAGNLGTPVAENIRSLNFSFYTDAAGKTLLTNPDGSAIANGRDAGSGAAPSGNFAAAGTGAIGGDGKYDPDNVGTTTNFADRAQRALIASIRVNLVGMNATPDSKYVAPTETIAGIKNYRQYALQSLVVPRNLGLTGFPEPTYNPPAPPTIVGMCVGHCGAPVIYWDPPASAGDVTKYRVEWDTVQNGAFTNGYDIDDPAARSFVIPDDGTSDVSQLRWFQMWSYNDNGRSLISSNKWSATPKNATKPAPPSGLVITNGQVNQIPMSWTSPSQNVSPKNVLACAGVGGSTDGTFIPTSEVVAYRVYRGEDPNFDPTTPGASFVVLDTSSAGQPLPPVPGAVVSWSDTGIGAKSDAPPANCISYYYRVQALDRCYKSASWNASGTAADSASTFYPPVGQSAMGPFASTSSGFAPVVSPSLTVNKAISGCPDPTAPLSTNCRIALQWQKSTLDTATPQNPIGVEWYVITRGFRVQAVGGSFTPDTNFGANGQKQVNCDIGTCVNGFSQSSPSALATYTDTPPILNGNGAALEYQYTVAAKNCTTLYSGSAPNGIAQAALPPNPQVIYPGCTVNPTIVESGDASRGSGTVGGDSPNDPWVFNAGDTVTVNPPAGVTIQNVVFELYTLQGSLVGQATPVSTSPFRYTWSAQTESQTYMLRMTVTVQSVSGSCSETHVKYIQDQEAAACAFQNVTAQPALSASVENGNGSNAVVTLTQNFTISNGQAVALNMARGNIATITWGRPTGDTGHPDLKLVGITWGNSADNFSVTAATPAPTQTVTTRNYPAALTIAANGSMNLRFTWQYLKNDDCSPNNDCSGHGAFYDTTKAIPTTAHLLTKICMEYTITSEQGVTKHCNLLGQSNSTNNPTGCD